MRLFADICLNTSPVDGKVSSDSIREDLGMCLTQGRLHPC